MNMKLTTRAIALAALTSLAVFGLALQDGFPPFVKDKDLHAEHDLRGKKAPAFFIEKWANATEVDTRGKVRLIEFWQTTGEPCLKLIPQLNELQKKFKGKLLVIAVTDEPLATVKQFLKKNPVDYLVGVDTKKHMFNELGIKGIPHAILVTPDSIVRWQGFPSTPEDLLTDKLIQQVIDAAKVRGD
jgi:cytochrome c biogenesis protein CcmG, thiol:disulfide interchange protein DsbE